MSCFSLSTELIALNKNEIKQTGFNKGSFFFYWGYNRAYYSYSNIHFRGEGYDFTLSHVKAKDRPSKVGATPYLNIEQITIPQYNYRLGYNINSRYSISFGFDHMKYVMNQNQTVNVDGFIKDSKTTYDGVYRHTPLELKKDFLEFEHTDGLNYLNFELTRKDKLLSFHKNIQLNSVLGGSIGGMFPRTRTILMQKNLNDEWHFSGVGVTGNLGLNTMFFKRIFLQSTVKLGYINLPSIVVSSNKNEKADQHFSFLQVNVVLGYQFNLKR
ncbi:MAG: hypothetical protein R2852_00980 [Bacteroidia bacterium]